MSARQDDSGEDGCRTGQIRRGRMQDRTDAGLGRCITGWMEDKMNAGQKGCTSKLVMERMDAYRKNRGRRYAG